MLRSLMCKKMCKNGYEKLGTHGCQTSLKFLHICIQGEKGRLQIYCKLETLVFVYLVPKSNPERS